MMPKAPIEMSGFVNPVHPVNPVQTGFILLIYLFYGQKETP
jgi:hypothetical protein